MSPRRVKLVSAEEAEALARLGELSPLEHRLVATVRALHDYHRGVLRRIRTLTAELEVDGILEEAGVKPRRSRSSYEEGVEAAVRVQRLREAAYRELGFGE